jgi:hypothetical protein
MVRRRQMNGGCQGLGCRRFEAKSSVNSARSCPHPTYTHQPSTNLRDIHGRSLASSGSRKDWKLFLAAPGFVFQPRPHVSASSYLPVSGNTSREEHDDSRNRHESPALPDLGLTTCTITSLERPFPAAWSCSAELALRFDHHR